MAPPRRRDTNSAAVLYAVIGMVRVQGLKRGNTQVYSLQYASRLSHFDIFYTSKVSVAFTFRFVAANFEPLRA